MADAPFDGALFDEVLFDQGVTGDLTSLKINGVEYLHRVLVRDFDLSREINGVVHTFQFSLLDDAGGSAVSAGDDIILDSIDGRLFRGYVSRLKPTKLNDLEIAWCVSCQDYTRLLEAAMTGEEVFTSTTDKNIIQYLFGKYVPSVDVSTYVSEIITLSSLDLSYRNMRQCMEIISGITQGVWYVDADLKLHYFASGDRMAPFGLNETGGGEGMLRSGGPDYTIDFTAPCNKCTVRNMYEEESTQSNFNPPATGDDGDVSKTSANWPPEGAVTVVTDAQTITARRRLNNTEQQTDQEYYPTASGDDGEVYLWGTGYPPSGTPQVLTGGSTIEVRRSQSGPNYGISNGLVRFDTSGIPDAAEIVSASLNLSVTNYEQTDAYTYFTGEWYDSSNWPIDSSDYTATAGNNAHSGTLLQGLGTGWKEFSLNNPNSYISKTGYTGLRLHIDCAGGAPTGLNYILFSAFDSGTKPYLKVTYKTGGTEYTISCALVRFDTSALPDTAIISGATLKLKIGSKTNPDNAEIGIEYYASANWPIDSGDYTATPSNTAWGYTALSAIPAAGQWLNVPLTSPNSNISKTGYTGFRIHIKTAGTPTGDNLLTFASQESADDPVLEIVYIPGAMISGTYEDAASQTAHGVFERQIVNPRLLSQAEAEQQAESEVVRAAWPGYAFSATVRTFGLDIGQLVHVIIPSYAVNADFLIRRLRITTRGKNALVYSIEAGDFRDDLYRYLRRVALSAKSINV